MRENMIVKRLLQNNINICYTCEKLPNTVTRSIFLAGPCPRNSETESWRPQVIQYLKSINWSGTIYYPENGSVTDYSIEERINWEQSALNRADIILFWIPRDLTVDSTGQAKMLALTTNIEFGLYLHSNKIVVGGNQVNNEYIEYSCKQQQIPFFTDLNQAIQHMVNILADGAIRHDGECSVPLFIWNHPEFINWYKSLKAAGNTLINLENIFSFIMPIAKKLFMWICKVKIYVAKENRIKENEFVVSRTNTAAAVLYYKDNNDINIVLVKEFRSPVNNDEGFVYDLPSGSSDNPQLAINTVINEVKEETGFNMNPLKVKAIQSRQTVSTLLANKVHAYKYQLDDIEFNEIKQLANTMHGNIEATEQTYIEIKTINDILENNLVDWNNLGIILSAIKEG